MTWVDEPSKTSENESIVLTSYDNFLARYKLKDSTTKQVKRIEELLEALRASSLRASHLKLSSNKLHAKKVEQVVEALHQFRTKYYGCDLAHDVSIFLHRMQLKEHELSPDLCKKVSDFTDWHLSIALLIQVIHPTNTLATRHIIAPNVCTTLIERLKLFNDICYTRSQQQIFLPPIFKDVVLDLLATAIPQITGNDLVKARITTLRAVLKATIVSPIEEAKDNGALRALAHFMFSNPLKPRNNAIAPTASHSQSAEKNSYRSLRPQEDDDSDMAALLIEDAPSPPRFGGGRVSWMH